MPPTVNVIPPEGGPAIAIPEDALESAKAAGFTEETPGQFAAREAKEGQLAPYRGIGGGIKAGIQGTLRGATLGLSDLVQRAGGTSAEELRLLEEAHPGISTATEIGAGLGTAILSGGSGVIGQAARLTPTGAVSARALSLGRSLAPEGATAARHIGGYAAAGAVEGAAQGVGSYLSDIALENKELSAEGFLASAGQGALWGGAAGGVLAGVERGTIAARRLFPRSQYGDREAQQIAEETFKAKSEDVLRSGDELEDIARYSADDLRLRSAELNLERERIRSAEELSPASKIRLQEINVEKAKIAARRKELRAERNAARARKGLADLPEEAPVATPPLAEAAVVPTGPPPAAVDAPIPQKSPDLAGADDLLARLGATKGLLDEGMSLPDIGAAARAADADVAVVDRIVANAEDYAVRKQAVRDWIAGVRETAGPQKYEYRNSFTGEKLGGAAPVRTDRVRTTFTDEPGSVYDRVWAGIGDDVGEAASKPPLDPVIPPGWVDDDLFEGGAKEIRVGIPAAAEADPAVGYVVRPSELASSGRIFGNPKTGAGTKQQIRDEWARGDRLSPVDIQIDPDGRMFVLDGNHRLHVAAESDRPILARFTRTESKRRLGDADRILGDTGRPSAAADGPIEIDVNGQKLRLVAEEQTLPGGMKKTDVRIMRRLSDGEEVPVADAQFRHRPDSGELFPENVQVQPAWQRKGLAAKIYEVAEQRTGLKIIPSDSQTEAGAALSKAFRSRRDAGAAAPRRSGAELDRAYDDLIERASQADDAAALKEVAKQAAAVEEEIFSRVEARGGIDAELVAKIRARRAEFGWTAEDVAMRRAEKLAIAEPGPAPLSARARAEDADIAALEAAMRREQFGSGRTAGEVARDLARPRTPADEILDAMRAERGDAPGLGRFVEDADEAIRRIGEMERAEHALVQSLTDAGVEVPPAAAERAAAYSASIDDQARKVAESTARAVDAKQATSVISLPKPPPVPVDKGRAAAGRALDAFAALDTVNDIASVIPGMPNARDLPVVGPLLSMYLKYRAGRAAVSRLGGRIGLTTESKVAAKASEVRDKVADVVDSLLAAAPKAARAARRPAVVGGAKALDILRSPLYADGEKREEPKTARDALKARVEELSAAAASPDTVKAEVSRQLGAKDPDLARAIEEATLRKLQYLQRHAPKSPPPGPFGARQWTPSAADIERFARRVRAAEDPVTVFEDLEAGRLTAEAADTLRVVYPRLFAEAQQRLLSRAAELRARLPYKRVLQTSLLFDAPLDPSVLPGNVAALQAAHASSAQAGTSQAAAGAPQGQPPVPSVARPPDLSTLVAPDSQRRALRR